MVGQSRNRSARAAAMSLALLFVFVAGGPQSLNGTRAPAHGHGHGEINPHDVWVAQNSPVQEELAKPQSGPGISYWVGGPAKSSPARGELYDVGVLAAEPTMGITSDGTVFFKGLRTDSPGGLEWPVVASTDNGKTWEDASSRVGSQIVHAYGQDPFFYIDKDTDRIFDNDWTGPCTLLSFRDLEDEDWTHTGVCGLTDHQNIFSGPPATSSTIGYPNVVYYCAIDAGALASYSRATSCNKSIDGGLTWARTGAPAFFSDPTFPDPGAFGIPGFCDGATGHGFVDEKGKVYLPRGYCTQPWLAISADEGRTWERVQVADNGVPTTPDNSLQEHEAGVVVDSKGNIYYFYTAKNRLPYLVISRDGGKIFSKPIPVGPPKLKEAGLPTIDIGDDGKIAMAYVGSTDAPGGKAPQGMGPEYEGTTWHGYLTVTTNALAKRPRFTTVTINSPKDPLQFHACGIVRCAQQFDFIDVIVAPDGIAWMSAVDGCTADVPPRCVTFGRGVAGRMIGGPRLK